MVFRRLTNTFFGKSGGNIAAPENRTYGTPPVAEGAWHVVADKHGNIVTDRPVRNDDFLARPPLEYNYGGTIPAYDSNDRVSSDQKISDALNYTLRDSLNKELLQKAIFLLSQTSDGRRLLHLARENEFSFIFDEERTKSEGAAGLCDYKNKLVPLAEGNSAEQVALTLKHELQHMEDIQNGIGYGPSHTLSSSIMADRALEANARVSEAILCAEILHGNPNGPERQFKTSDLFTNFFQKNNPMAVLAQKNIGHAKQKDWASFAQKVFPGYFSQHATLDYYDDRQAEMYTRDMPPTDLHFAPSKRNIEHYTEKLESIGTQDHWTHHQDNLKQKITAHGISYLAKGSNTDLSQTAYSSVSTKASEKLQDIVHSAEIMAPEITEHIKTVLFAPIRNSKKGTQQDSPYPTKQSEEDFIPIQHPYRTDGSFLADGVTTTHANVTQLFKKEYELTSNYPSELDRIALTIENMQTNAPHNIQGTVSRLVEAGMRVPVAALPFAYIRDIAQKAKHLVATGNNEFNQTDLKLMQHWQKLAKEGHDPVFLNKKQAGISTLFQEDSVHLFNAYLKPYFDRLSSEHQSPEARSDLKKVIS